LLVRDFLEFFTSPWYWADLVFAAIGAVLLLPLILRKRSRKRHSELLTYDGLVMVGFCALAVIWAGFFVYNRFVAQ
jgi:hypothetical protein